MSMVRRVCYPNEAQGNALFVPVCRTCGRFVTADLVTHWRFVPNNSWVGGYLLPVEPNATCKRCGRVSMVWEGFE